MKTSTVYKACSDTGKVIPLEVITRHSEYYTVRTPSGTTERELRVTPKSVVFEHQLDAFEYLLEDIKIMIKKKEEELGGLQALHMKLVVDLIKNNPNGQLA